MKRVSRVRARAAPTVWILGLGGDNCEQITTSKNTNKRKKECVRKNDEHE